MREVLCLGQHASVAAIWIALMTAAPGMVPAAPVPILGTGSVSNRVNLAVLPEGYTVAQSNLFLIAATNAVHNLLSEPPLSDYSNHFNAVALFVASAQSGSDHPVAGSSVDTYFNSTYDPQSDYLITIPPNWANPNPADGQGKVDALLAAEAPETDLTLMLVNDPTSGGSDGGGTLAIASLNSPAILVHEVGHVLANLGDEYEWANPGYPDTEEPNTTRETNRAAIKWNVWFSTNTPVPTPETAAYKNVVGLFEGAHYNSTGWYRPKFDCAMRTPGQPFCEVCGEALVLAVYGNVRPLDARTPSAANLAVTSPDPIEFELTLVEPATHALAVQWYTNGVPVTGATSGNFTVDPAQLGDGLHTVRADLIDPTLRVRTDPAQRLQQTTTWTLDVAVPWLRLEDPAWTAEAFSFRVVGAAVNGFVVECSTNLAEWIPVETNQLISGQAWYTNAAPPPREAFHRAVAQP